MTGTTICPLADALAIPVLSYLQKFRDEFVEHVRRKKCWFSAYEVRPANNSFWEDVRT